jgi:hypothetical protein
MVRGCMGRSTATTAEFNSGLRRLHGCATLGRGPCPWSIQPKISSQASIRGCNSIVNCVCPSLLCFPPSSVSPHSPDCTEIETTTMALASHILGSHRPGPADAASPSSIQPMRLRGGGGGSDQRSSQGGNPLVNYAAHDNSNTNISSRNHHHPHPHHYSELVVKKG